jgi:YD repeat-containing protein
MLDGWKVLWGMNPLLNNPAQGGTRVNYVYDGIGRLESATDSTAFTEIFGFDAEGNITSDQQ